jgi:hypothetical protein
LAIDASAVEMLRARGAFELAMGEDLEALFKGDRLLQLGYSRQIDYARERLGIATRTLYLWTRLARELEPRPILRTAVRQGRVSARKALTVAPVAVGEAEESWTRAALECRQIDLERAVRKEGAEPPCDTFEVENLWLRMDASQQDRLDRALAMARANVGAAAPEWQCLEVLCQEWLGSYGLWQPLEEAASTLTTEPNLRASAVARQLAALAEVDRGRPEEDAFGLDARLLRLLAAHRGFDEAFGVVAEQIVSQRVWESLGFANQEEYCRERLQVSARTLRQAAALERRLQPLPELRAAFAEGRLSFVKANLISRQATPENVAALIEEAESTTWQQLRRAADESEQRQNRAAGVRRLWGPKDAAATLAIAIECAQAHFAAVTGETIDAAEALARISDHFVEVWSDHGERRWVPPARRQARLRLEGLCEVPGCTRAARHLHHMRFRSQGGSDEADNLVALCVPHHLRGVHAGYLSVSGCAGDRLVWAMGLDAGVPLETWVTEGANDVRRAS